MGKGAGHYLKRLKQGALKEYKTLLMWLYPYAKAHKISIVVYTVIGMSATVVSLFGSLVSRDLVDIITGHQTGRLVVTFVLMVGVTVFSTIIGQCSSYIATKILLKVENNVKHEIFEKIMSTEWEELNRYHSGEICARWNGDSMAVANGILNLLPNAVIFTFRFVSALVMVCKYDASFAVFALLGAPISMISSREAMRRMRKQNMELLQSGTQMSAFQQETFSNMQTVKAFDLPGYYSKKLRELQQNYTRASLKNQKATIVNTVILTFISLVVSYAAQGWGVYKVWRGDISYGTMTMFITLSATLSGTVNNLLGLFPSSISLFNAVRRLRELTELPKEKEDNREEVKAYFEEHKNEGIGIYVQNLTYHYPEGEQVFEHASFFAKPSEIVALVGPSGEGKTTMLRYLLALLRTEEGKGCICAGDSEPTNGNGIEIAASVRQLIAYVPQGNTMFSGTIAENMRAVFEDASDEEIIHALKKACAWEFVNKLPQGINSPIQERGGGFSEGQAQRLSIARALLRESPILLLDEATSALDIATERAVLENITKDEKPRTCIVTTHRPTVLKHCNRVYQIRDKECKCLTEREVAALIEDFSE